jgi:NADH-quinone oxidoreductase subunit E
MSFHPVMDYGRGYHVSARALPEEGPPFTFSAEFRAKLDEICSRYPEERRKSAVIAALYLAQRQQGHITRNAIRHVAEVIRCTPAEVEDVVSFYTMFYTRPVGRHVVQVCRTLSCRMPRGVRPRAGRGCERQLA